ncbi:unnamed protein product [Trichogramma brassicae]|uniref:Uncharacterized protein n=1 Tax=Trichogramma brassicae TaxID=86971 RepID=A0A6H5IWB8_9HYME|nr:unnamed protein product [Trichogramma brassicae]
MSSSDDSVSDQDDQTEFLHELESIRKSIDWEVEKERRLLFDRVRFLIRNWKGQLPDLQDIFRAEEVDWILSQSVESTKELLIEFVVKCGYKDKPQAYEDGKPSPRRTTPVHHMWLEDDCFCVKVVSNLFKIYDRFDVNYTDASGLTHFHVACNYGCNDVVKKFLKLGQNPKQLVLETGDSPLHLALAAGRMEVVKLLLKHGANPNSKNKNDKTPLHSVCERYDNRHSDSVETFFKMCDERRKTVQIDAKDNSGDTPLHSAVYFNEQKTVEALLRRGADPNSANGEGLTPLHYICKDPNDDGMAELFFKVNDETNQLVQVDALDKLGRTPLQYAVAGFLPRVVDLLLDHGADLSKFVFPTESYYGRCFTADYPKLDLASECLTVVERLEKRGYKLDRTGALTIMKFFVEYKLFAESANLEKSWYDDKQLIRKTKEIKIIPSLSLFNVICLSPEEAAKQLTYTDYYKFAEEVSNFEILLPESHQDACALHLCEKMSRRFFLCWALKSLSKLTRHRLPVEGCRMIIEPLLNKDLCNITLATKD